MKAYVSIFSFNEVSCIYWLGLQGQQADLVVRDYTIISLQLVTLLYKVTVYFGTILVFNRVNNTFPKIIGSTSISQLNFQTE